MNLPVGQREAIIRAKIRLLLEMSSRATKVIILVLLLAAAAFVIDVLSPATPTPNAIGANLVWTLQLLLVSAFLFAPVIAIAIEGVSQSSTVYGQRAAQRSVIALNCVLLC